MTHTDTWTTVAAHCSLRSTYLLHATDTVEHTVLLTRLENSFGVAGLVKVWIASYLANRTQFVRVGSETCAATNCSCGVPQGSVLGPLLFVVYISPLKNISLLLTMTCYITSMQMTLNCTSH